MDNTDTLKGLFAIYVNFGLSVLINVCYSFTLKKYNLK